MTALIIALSLNVSGSVELNPGPMKKCPKCEKMMPTRFNADVVICYAMFPAARVLHFSTFIIFSYQIGRHFSASKLTQHIIDFHIWHISFFINLVSFH